MCVLLLLHVDNAMPLTTFSTFDIHMTSVFCWDVACAGAICSHSAHAEEITADLAQHHHSELHDCTSLRACIIANTYNK